MVRRIINGLTVVFSIGLAVAMLQGCYYDVEEQLYPGGCNSENVTYSGAVLLILQRDCYTCHDALTQNGGINLEGYDRVFTVAQNGMLLGAIRHEPGYTPMPDARPKLDACTIEKIEKWVEAGALNN